MASISAASALYSRCGIQSHFSKVMPYRSVLSAFGIVAAMAVSTSSFATQTPVGIPQPTSFSVYQASAPSLGQDIWPFATQSDPVGFDSGGTSLSSGDGLIAIDLFHLAVNIQQSDISLPTAGPGVEVARSFNGVQVPNSISPSTINISASRRNSDGYQGWNWFQHSRPELVKSWSGTGAGNASTDRLYVIAGAAYALEFKRDGSGLTFVGVNGTQGAIVHTENTGGGVPGLYEYRDLTGAVLTFFDFDGDAYGAAGQLWKVQDADGSAAATTAYVGHATTISSALAGFIQDGSSHATAQPDKIYDSAGREYDYSYSTYGSKSRVASVIVKLSGTEVARSEYDYYTSLDAGKGLAGDLRSVTVTLPLSSGGSDVRTTYYRYYTDATYHASTNPGHPHQIKLIVGPEGVRAFGASYGSASDSTLQPYVSGMFTYGSDARLATALFNGECGCSGGGMGGNGTYAFSLESNANFGGNWSDGTYDGAGDWTASQWAMRTIITTPDSKKMATYFDEAGQSLGSVKSSANDFSGGGNQYWVTKHKRDTSGRVVATFSPAVFATAVGGGYTHSTGGGTNGGTLAAGGGGLCTHMTYSSDAYLKSSITQTEHSDGPTGTKFADITTDYVSASSKGYRDHGSARIARPLPSARKQYITDEVTIGGASSSDYSETTHAYTYWQQSGTDTWRTKSITTTNPIVASGTNGSGSATTTAKFIDELGRTKFSRDEMTGSLERYVWTDYDSATGEVTAQVDDASSSTSGASADDATWGISLPSAGLARTTTRAYDAQGRLTDTIDPSGRHSRIHHTKLADGRIVTLLAPIVTSGTTYHSPVTYTVTNLADKTEARCTIAFGTTTTAMSAWIDESKSDVKQAISTGSLGGATTTTYNETGTRELATSVWNSFGSSSVLVGGSGAAADITTYTYDVMGRRVTTTDPTGTITKTVFDSIGRQIESWLGTVDGGGGDNMTKVSSIEYDSGAVGNGFVSKQTLFVENSTSNMRQTSFAGDYRGRMRLKQNPVAPHSVTSYDNANRVLIESQYSSTSGLNASTDPGAAASNRVQRRDFAYDSRGRVWKTTLHKITQSGGSAGVSADSLDELKWYDAAGRVVKSAGSSITKFEYDRIGREIRHFSLASTDDSAYADADDVGGDIVLEEAHTTYDSTTGNPIVSAIIKRHPNESTSTYGALYSSIPGTSYAYSSLVGRIDITAMYYDVHNRLTSTALYGSAGITTTTGSWSRASSAPSSTDSILVLSRVYNDAGFLKDSVDPMNHTTRTEYDGAGQLVRLVKNYVDGTPSADTDQTVEYTYENAQLVRISYKNAGSSDQDTNFVYGVARGGSTGDSRVTSNRLIAKVTLPDSSDSSDSIKFAYNAQGDIIYRLQQNGNAIVIEYDSLGRETARVVDSLGTSIDSSTRAVTSSYSSRGLAGLITQYSDAAMSTATSQVQYVFDDWGNLVKMEQDVDGVVGAGGIAARSIEYAFAKASPSGGATTLRRTSLSIPGSKVINFIYDGVIANKASRVDRVDIEMGSTDLPIASYEYLGRGRVTSTILNEPGARSAVFVSSTSSYSGIDSFGRMIRDTWERISGAFYTDSKFEYNRNGVMVAWTDELTRRQASGASQFDHVFDRVMTNDALSRLIKADDGQMTGSVGSRSIASGKHLEIEQWSLSHTGAWVNQQYDGNGDGDLSDAVDMDVDGIFNKANEYYDSNPATPTWGAAKPIFDQVGQLTDDGQSFQFVYDAFGRMVRVLTRDATPVTIAEYKYDGLGHCIQWHVDSDGDSDLDTNDKWFAGYYDEQWRLVASYRDSDSSPKEQLIYHAAGDGGMGSSSYVDAVILRDVDESGSWNAASDGVLETRTYMLQNWRGDVVCTINGIGDPLEYVRYSAYGVPTVYAAGDMNRDGVCDSADEASWYNLWDSTDGDALRDCDVNRDGAVSDSDDWALVADQAYSGRWAASGSGVLSRLGNRKGFAGYEWANVSASYHVRNRVYLPANGIWTTRDPGGYTTGGNLYEYCASAPGSLTDSSGFIGCVPFLDGHAPYFSSTHANTSFNTGSFPIPVTRASPVTWFSGLSVSASIVVNLTHTVTTTATATNFSMDMNSFATLNATAIVNGTMRVWWVPNYPNVPFQFNVTNLVLPGGSTMTLHNYYRWQIFCNAACEAKQKRDANVDPATPGYNGSNHASMTGLLGNLDLTNEPGFGGNLEAYPEAISVWGGPAVSISGQFTVSPFGIGVSVQFATTFTPALRTSAPLEPFVWKCMPYAGPTVIRPR